VEEVVALAIDLMSVVELLIAVPDVEFERLVDVCGERLFVARVSVVSAMSRDGRTGECSVGLWLGGCNCARGGVSFWVGGGWGGC
jgi:hypothetical protein